MPDLQGKICLVTGASRGIGRGIAIQLIANGATVYITGRKKESLELVAQEAKERSLNGTCVPVECDHSDDESVKNVFKKIQSDHKGQFDLLVNNAYAAVNYILEQSNKPFWEQPENGWDVINNVGLRNHFLCAIHASKIMVPNRRGLIVNISSVGGVAYFQTAAYGIGKNGKDRMARDCGLELEKYNVAFVSLWPGPVKTETVMDMINKKGQDVNKQLKWMFNHGESTEFAGKAISHMLTDKEIIRRTGKIILTTDLAEEFGFHDIDGSHPVSMRSFEMGFANAGIMWIASLCPRWLKVPLSIFKMIAGAKTPDLNKTLTTD